MVIHQAASHKADANVIFFDLQPFSKVRRSTRQIYKYNTDDANLKKYDNANHLVRPKSGAPHPPLPPSTYYRLPSPDMRKLISPVLQTLAWSSLWGRSQLCAKSKFVLVCPSCLLLTLIYGVGSAFSKLMLHYLFPCCA